MDPAEILKRPYARLVLPHDDGTVSAEIVEFPGCFAEGANAAEALAKLDEVAIDWIAATVEQGQEIPEPMESAGYSGKLVLRMPTGLHKRATLCAEREGTSLNQFIVTCIAETVGERARPAPLQVQTLFGFHGTNVFVQSTGEAVARPVAVTGTRYGLAGAWTASARSFGAQVTDIQLPPVWERQHARS
jgi:predicted HicB family RNase H-like nuclease